MLDEGTAAHLRESLDQATDLELAWAGESSTQLLAEAPAVQVVLANIDQLGDDPVGRMNAIVDATHAELGIALYAFAKRDLLDRLGQGRVRTLRAPINLSTLRGQMMSVIARNLLVANLGSASIAPPRYNAVQLGKLQQISTSIECECPNHLAVLLQNLADFEAYSSTCSNRNPADAELHRLLYEHTARARAIMERAMDRLIVHENIVV